MTRMLMRSPYHCLIVCLLALISEPALAIDSNRYVDEIFSRISIVSNIVYGKAATVTGEQEKLCLDLYAPEEDTEASRAVIFLIHGGGFYKGDKQDVQMATLATRFARRGYVVLSINYRLMPSKSDVSVNHTNAMRMAAEDANAGLDWVSKNRLMYRMDPSRLVIGGGSAGAFTSLIIAYGPERNLIRDVRIRAVIDFWGGLPRTESMKRGDPPLIIIHGTDDKIVPCSYAERLNTRAKEVGIACEFHPLVGSGHAAWGELDTYITWIVPFLYRYVINVGQR